MSNSDTPTPPQPPAANWEYIPRDDATRTRDLAQDQVIGTSSGPPEDQQNDSGPPPRANIRRPLILFIATCISTTYVAALSKAQESGVDSSIFTAEALQAGLSYSSAIMLILLCHEFGHYLQARRYQVQASLPYFIPMPFSPLGTMGAVIAMSRRIPNRKALFDIGISGPLAGIVPALLFAWFGIAWSEVVPFNPSKEAGPLFGIPLIVSWMIQFHHSVMPVGYVLQTHPFAMAGWTGIFVTALNLVPIGQLDGGHILYAILQKRSYPITTFLLYGGFAFMVLTNNYTWLVIILLLLYFGPKHPPTHHDNEPLGWRRTILGWATLSFIIIGFTPVPIVFMP